MSNAPQILDGSFRDIREPLNALPDTGQRVHVVLWKEEGVSPEAINPALGTKNAAAIAYLQERLKNAPTDPEVIRQAEAEQEELLFNLNKNRVEAGERPLFPE